MSQSKSTVPHFFHSLRVKMALGVALPVLVLSQAMPVVHAWRERQLIDEQARFVETQLTGALSGSLQQALLSNDRAMMTNILEHVVSADGIQRVRLLNLAGEVTVDSSPAGADGSGVTAEGGCDECHARPLDQRQTALMLTTTGSVMRFVAPIRNQPDCAACHDPAAPHPGVLLTEVSTRTLDEHLASDLAADFALALLISIALAVVAYLLLHWLLIRRLDRMREPLLKFADGDFAQRLPGGNDEIGELAETFNNMARQLEQSIEFLSMLEGVQRGESAMQRQTMSRLLDSLSDFSREPVVELTVRELELLKWVAQGYSNKAIAKEMSISPNTVKYHMKSVLQKLNVQNRAEAVATAIRAGWLPEQPAVRV